MKSISEIKAEEGTWLFLTPVNGLILSEAVNHEYKFHKVTFVSSNKLALRRKRLGFPYRISELKNKFWGLWDDFFSEEKTYAVLRLRGYGNKVEDKFIKIIREELAILSLSQLGFSRRRFNSAPVMSRNTRPAILNYFLINTNTNSCVSHNEIIGKIGHLSLNDLWVNYCRKVFFLNLTKIISGKIRVGKNWQQTIRNASILAGQSQSSFDLPQSFLWNIIAIEMLLTQEGDKISDSLNERAKAFIGWSSAWNTKNFEEKIDDVYKKRCKFVHNGNRDLIQISDVLFTDDLLQNILINIVRHPKLFYSKKQLVLFSEKTKAEHVLGLRSKTRPKTFSYIHRKYIDADYEKI